MAAGCGAGSGWGLLPSNLCLSPGDTPNPATEAGPPLQLRDPEAQITAPLPEQALRLRPVIHRPAFCSARWGGRGAASGFSSLGAAN